MSHTTKANNRHRLHPTQCVECGRQLPKRAYRATCASCRKWAAGFVPGKRLIAVKRTPPHTEVRVIRTWECAA